jgi:predicted CXXCH cytochrome family protein
MRVLIRSWTREGGERSAQDRIVETLQLRIGRGTDQDIELADLRVPLALAEIVIDGTRRLAIHAKGGQRVWINDAPATDGRLAAGDTIDCGRYRLTVQKPPKDVDALIEVEERISARDERSERLARLSTSLEAAGLSRRRLSWLLFFAVLLPSLLIPAYLRYGLPPTPQAQAAKPAWPTDHVWNPGPSSTSHGFFINDCARCHKKPFEQVTNAVCLDCHKGLHHHAEDARWAQLPVFAQAKCEDCHQEHEGQAGLVDTRNPLCTACHAKPQQQFAGIDLEPARDFSKQHPSFKPRVARYDTSVREFRFITVSDKQPQELYSDTNLIYPHDVHLKPEGIKSPSGNKVLKCADCHELDSSGVSFKPIDMQRHCAECHRLDFDPDAPDRVVPHGSEAQTVQAIRDYFARVALAGGVTKPDAPAVVQMVRKPGEQLDRPSAQIALAWADQQADRTIDEVFDKRICGYCHTVERTGDAALPFRVPPVQLQTRIFPHGEFSHAAHRQEKCTSCHAAETSKHSEDLLMPEIKRCRDCHDDPGADAKVQSPCTECHGFHIAPTRTMDVANSAATAAAMPKSAPAAPVTQP